MAPSLRSYYVVIVQIIELAFRWWHPSQDVVAPIIISSFCELVVACSF